MPGLEELLHLSQVFCQVTLWRLKLGQLVSLGRVLPSPFCFIEVGNLELPKAVVVLRSWM